mgnify:CR=1 FL=1|tara:strand:+ start:1673 stop:1876 length:204 start_codon:yes stop_codon:yes gene_type:complete
MTLKEYLDKKKTTQMNFIKEIESSYGTRIPQGTFAKWVTGVRIPRKKEMQILTEATRGKVTANDFYR